MILSDGTIRKLLAEGRIRIDPLEESFIQPASVDVRLDSTFLAFRRHTTSDIDPWQTNENLMEKVVVEEGQPFILHPRAEEHTSELQSPCNLACRLLVGRKR